MTCTWCYVCGGQSILAEDCVDEYPLTMREDNKQNCDEVLGHTVGCVKSKYVDLDGKQIGKFFLILLSAHHYCECFSCGDRITNYIEK